MDFVCLLFYSLTLEDKMNNLELLEQIDRMLKGNEKPLTMDEACEFLGMKKGSLYKLTHKKVIPFSKPNGKMIYFRKADLVNWMMKNPVKSAEQIDQEAANYIILNKVAS